jgi:prepilin-type processing-associated H-X9-DG protein
MLVAGKLVKTYGFADGHAEVKVEPPEGFEAWEKRHMAIP